MRNNVSQVSLTPIILVDSDTISPNATPLQATLFDSDGAQITPLSTQSNTAALHADAAAPTSAAAVGSTPTKAEFDLLRADYIALRTSYNGLLTKLRTAGLVSTT